MLWHHPASNLWLFKATAMLRTMIVTVVAMLLCSSCMAEAPLFRVVQPEALLFRVVQPVPTRAAPKPGPKAAAVPIRSTGPVHMNWNISGDWSPTEAETREHLLNDHGQTTESLKGLSFQQLLDLHDALHNGTTAKKTSTSSQWFFNSNDQCPGGVCPSNQNRGGGRSRRSRR